MEETKEWTAPIAAAWLTAKREEILSVTVTLVAGPHQEDEMR